MSLFRRLFEWLIPKRKPTIPIADPYKERVRLSPNKGGTIDPKFIVLHHTAGSFQGGVSWILNPASKVSYHYLIDPDNGNRIQMVWDRKRAWHAGRSKWKGFSGLNGHSIGIAFAGDTNTREVADHEIDSVAHKCLYLMNKFDLDTSAIVTHAMISPGRKTDCSEGTYHRVRERVEELA